MGAVEGVVGEHFIQQRAGVCAFHAASARTGNMRKRWVSIWRISRRARSALSAGQGRGTPGVSPMTRPSARGRRGVGAPRLWACSPRSAAKRARRACGARCSVLAALGRRALLHSYGSSFGEGEPPRSTACPPCACARAGTSTAPTSRWRQCNQPQLINAARLRGAAAARTRAPSPRRWPPRPVTGRMRCTRTDHQERPRRADRGRRGRYGAADGPRAPPMLLT